MHILQIDCVSGAGTHLIENIVDAAGLQRFDPNLLKLGQAYIEYQRDPASLSCVAGFGGGTGETAVRQLLAEHDPDAEVSSVPEIIDREVRKNSAERRVIINYDNLLTERHLRFDNGSVASWYFEDVIALRELISGICSSAGEYSSVAIIRHPVDMLLSKRERGGLDSQLISRVSYYFQLVEQEGTATVKYEQLCQDVDSRPVLQALGLTEEEIDLVDPSVIHQGEIAKWRRYQFREVLEMATPFEHTMSRFGYGIERSRGVEIIGLHLRRLLAEISVINRMARGDYRASGAYNWHQRSLLGRIWLRLVLLSPSRRRNISNWHYSVGQMPPF